MKIIGLECVAGQMKIFSKTVNNRSKFEFAYGLVEAVIGIINTNDDKESEMEQLYEVAARWERDLNMVVTLELFLGVYKEICDWRNLSVHDSRFCYSIKRLNNYTVAINIDLDLTFERMLEKKKEKEEVEVKPDDVIDNPTPEQLGSLGV